MEFVVKNISGLPETSTVKTTDCSRNGQFVSVLSYSGDVYIVPVHGSGSNSCLLGSDFVRVKWHRYRYGHSPEILTCQSKEGHLELYTISNVKHGDTTKINITCQWQCHVNTLGSIFKDAEVPLLSKTCQLLDYVNTKLVLYGGCHVAMLQVQHERMPQHLSTIHIDEHKYVQVCNDCIFVLNGNGFCNVYSLETFTKLGFFLISSSVFQSEVGSFSVSDTLTNFCVVDDSGNVHIINIESSYQADSSQLSLQYGDISVNGETQSIRSSSTTWSDEDNASSWSAASARSSKSSFKMKREASKRKSKPSKNMARLTGFTKHQQREDNPEPGHDRELTVSLTNEAHICRDLVTTDHEVVIWLQLKNKQENIVYVVNVKSGEIKSHRNSAEEVYILPRGSTYPILQLGKTSLKGVLFDSQQSHFVNRLMLYESAGAADTVCQLNDWDRCSIPLYALEVGLKHRQLDVVTFYLKSRENLFASEGEQVALSEGDMEQANTAVELLISTIQDNIQDQQSRQFAEQLLYITMQYLTKVLHNVTSKRAEVRKQEKLSSSLDRNLAMLLERLTCHMQMLRQYLPGTVATARRHKALLDIKTPTDSMMANITSRQQGLVKHWKNLPEKEVIVEGIMSGEIPLLQAYLAARHKASLSGFDNIVHTGLHAVLSVLQQQQLLQASQILGNLGFDVWSKLHQICMYTEDHAIRDYLSKELQEQEELSQEEVDMVSFIHQLERVYSCASFEVAKLMRAEQHTECSWKEGVDLSQHLPENQAGSMLALCGEVGEVEASNTETAAYACVLLDWLRTWDLSTRARVLLDQLISRKGQSSSDLVDSTVLWEYLTSHLDLDKVMLWINSTYDPFTNASWPFSLEFKPQLLSNTANMTHYMQEKLLTLCAEKGILQLEEQENFSLLLKRLSQSQNLLAKPHVLSSSSGDPDTALLDFHRNMIQYCLLHKLPHLLAFYLDHYGLCQGSTEFGDVGLAQEELPGWVDMLLHLRAAFHHNLEPSSILQASLSNDAYLQGLQGGSVAALLDTQLIKRVMATLVYDPALLTQMRETPGSQQDKLKSCLSSAPRLYHAVFNEHPVTSTTYNEFSVYKLLQGNVNFDIGKLFAWQETNPLATEDGPKELPHFSQPDLVAKFAKSHPLTMVYYLKQGRPSYAFLSFILSLLQQGVKTISSRRMRSVATRVYQLALVYFHQQQVAAACVAFIEMLGSDSTEIRVYLQAAGLIYQHWTSRLEGQVEQRKQQEQRIGKEISQMMIVCLRSQQPPVLSQATSLLENAIQWNLEKQHIKVSSLEAGEHWLLAVMFCQCNNLPLPTEFLKECASRDQWITFLLFAQLHRYPPQQLLSLLPKFPSAHIREHLHYVINSVHLTLSDNKGQQGESPIKSRDVRAQLYSKIGLHTTSTGGSTEMGSVKDGSTTDSSVDTSEAVTTPSTEEVSSSIESLGQDVFSVLLKCQSRQSPWEDLLQLSLTCHNPVLAILAACYQETNTVACLCCWLVASVPASLCPLAKGVTSAWTNQDLQHIAIKLFKAGYLKTLQQGVHIFQPESMIQYFLDFLEAFDRYETETVCKSHLDMMKTKYNKVRRSLSSSDNRDVVEADLSWTEETVRSIIHHRLAVSSRRVGKLLHYLHEANITRFFSHKVGDISKLYQLHQICKESDVGLQYSVLIDPKHHSYESECTQVLDHLLTTGHFSEARLFAEVAGVSRQNITVQQLLNELSELLDSHVWEMPSARCTFWCHCHELLQRHQVSPPEAAKFFKDQLSHCKGHKEQGLVSQLAYDWLQRCPGMSVNEEMEKLFISIWTSKMAAHMEMSETASEHETDLDDIFTWPKMHTEQKLCPTAVSKTSLLHIANTPAPGEKVHVTLGTKEIQALNVLLGELIDAGQLPTVAQVCNIFGFYCQDYHIVRTCVELAKSTMKAQQLPAHLKRLITSSTMSRPRRVSTSLVSFQKYGTTLSVANLPAIGDESEADADPALATMQLLSNHILHSDKCCKWVIVNYRIAKAVGKSFSEVLSQSDLDLLHSLLSENLPYKYSLAKAFVSTSSLSPQQVAKFLTDSIVEALQVLAGLLTPEELKQGLLLKQLSQEGHLEGINELMQLCDDPSVLGKYLLDATVSFTAANAEHSTKLHTVEVELLIYAHDCFTLACHLEGISRVLHTCRTVCAALQQAEEYNLMIKLLTGVARFGEMAYIFDILKQQHQFELLFKKGIDKEDKLRVAVLDYLARSHPSDTETLTMVSLHFTMYRQIARMLEDAASLSLKQLKPLEDSQKVQRALQTIIHSYSDAAESYTKEKCIRAAQNCVKQARLVALQSQMLTGGQKVKIINLTQDEVEKFIATHLKFYESWTLAEAYNVTTAWAAAIVNIVLHQGDFKYLKDFQCQVTLSNQLLEEVAEKFRTGSSKSKQGVPNMKKLLKLCHDVRTRYKLANDLGFTDITRDMLKSDAGPYLRDILCL